MGFRFDPPDETELRQGGRQITRSDYEMKFPRVSFQDTRGSKIYCWLKQKKFNQGR